MKSWNQSSRPSATPVTEVRRVGADRRPGVPRGPPGDPDPDVVQSTAEDLGPMRRAAHPLPDDRRRRRLPCLRARDVLGEAPGATAGQVAGPLDPRQKAPLTSTAV